MKIGVIGAGLIAAEHLTGIRAIIDKGLVDASLAGVYDRETARAENFKSAFGFDKIYSSAGDLANSGEVDVLFVFTWTSEHAPLTELAAKAGKPLFCEKPLARNFEETKAMCRAVEQAGIPNQIGLILRTSPAYGFVKHLAGNKELGRLMAVNFQDDQYFPNQGRYASVWRNDVEKAGGGTFIEHSIHDVDVMRWIFGEYKNIRGEIRNFAGHPGIEDLTLATAEFQTGGHVQFLSIWHNILTRISTRHLEIFFENGRIVAPNELFGPVTLELGDRPLQTFGQADIARQYLNDNQDVLPIGVDFPSYTVVEDYRFLKSLADGKTPSPDFREGLAAHETVEAAYRSARAGKTLQLPLAD